MSGFVTPREGSSRFAAPSGTDFTNGGLNQENTYQIVKLNSTGQVVPSAASTDKHIGIIMNNPIVGDSADVLLINQMGTAKVQVGGAVNIGDYLTSDASGHAIATTAGGDIIIGQAVGAATSSPSAQLVEFLSYRGKL